VHREPVVTAATMGVHVLVEKPLALTTADAVVMRDAVAAAGVKAEVNFSNRWNPPFVSAKRSIEAGEIGRPLTVNSRLNNIISSPTKRLAWSGQTTSAWYLLSHVLDLWRWLSGKRAVSVYANGVKDKLVSLGVTTYDYIHALVKYDDGTDGMYEAAWMLPDSLPSPTDFKFHVIGREGAIFINTQDQMVHTASAQRYSYSATLEWAVQRFHGFLDVVQHDKPPVATFDDGVENTRILVAMHEALASGAVVPIAGQA
jgi:predicted dehydrogenase